MVFENFTWWSVLYILITTHITILTVTIYLHRTVAHRALTVAKPVEHFFRFWCWLTTGQSAKEWAAVHRKHHAFCEKEQDPHSPRIYGFWTVLFKGVGLYRKEAQNAETLEKYGKLTPDDWVEHNIYRKHTYIGLVALALFDLFMFGFHGIWIYLIQIAWIPFWAAGVINGLGHFKGYRNFNTEDDSTNISPWGFIIGGEELHNNHHAYPASAKFSMKWYEIDTGWFWIKLLSIFRLAKINKINYLPSYDKSNLVINENSIEAFVSHKYYVWSLFKSSTKKTVKNEITKMKENYIELESHSVPNIKKIFYNMKDSLSSQETILLNKILENPLLKRIHDFKEDLWKIWNNRHSSFNQIKDELNTLFESSKEMNEVYPFTQKVIGLKLKK